MDIEPANRIIPSLKNLPFESMKFRLVVPNRLSVFALSFRWIRVLIWALMLVLVAWWVSVLTSPRPVANLPARGAYIVEDYHASSLIRLFGAKAGKVHGDDGSLRLVGVFANERGNGFATFITREGSVSVLAGREIVPGVVLKKIHKDRVTVLHTGVMTEISLIERNGQLVGPVEPVSSGLKIADSVSQTTGNRPPIDRTQERGTSELLPTVPSVSQDR